MEVFKIEGFEVVNKVEIVYTDTYLNSCGLCKISFYNNYYLHMRVLKKVLVLKKENLVKTFDRSSYFEHM